MTANMLLGPDFVGTFNNMPHVYKRLKGSIKVLSMKYSTPVTSNHEILENPEISTKEKRNCVIIEDCYCECLNDINGDGVCDTLCSEDLNSDGSVSVADLLLVLSEFGCSSSCANDINLDGYVTVEDLLLVLSVFGDICE